MATSGTATYGITRDNLLTEALRSCGILEEGATATATQLTEWTQTLNIMLKSWGAYGLLLWKIGRTQITPTTSNTYTLGPNGSQPVVRPLDVIKAYRRETSTSIDVEMNKITREEYWGLSDKDQTGTPISFYYDPQLTDGKMYVWPVADSTFIANNTIDIIYRTHIQDMTSSTDDFDLPQEWYAAVVDAMAVKMGLRYGVEARTMGMLKALAMESLDLAKSWDTEHASVYFKPDNQGRQ